MRELLSMRVLVTRSVHQAESLAALIEDAGGHAVRFPVLEICAPSDAAAVEAAISRLKQFELVIFTSANAVRYTARQILAQHGPLTERPLIAAIGSATAAALATQNINTSVVPSGQFSSEGLLRSDALQHVRGRRIAIFAGQGWRRTLPEVLTARGAVVEVIGCYRRRRSNVDSRPLVAEWKSHGMDMVTVTSGEAARNLCALMGQSGQALLFGTPVVAISERVAAICTELGWGDAPLVAECASDVGIVNTIKQWRQMNCS